MYKLKYIGPTQVLNACVLNAVDINNAFIDFPVENGQEFLVDLQYNGAINIIMGQVSFSPDTTIWIIFPFLNARLAYSPEAILNHWKML